MLEIGRSSVIFEPDCGSSTASSSGTMNFYDTSSSRICTMRNNGTLSFTCKSFDKDVISTRTRDRGPALGVKISPNGKLAAVQRQANSVDVILLEKTDGSGVALEFNVPSKSRETIILVEWVNDSQLLFVTNQCMELFSIIEGKRSSKMIKSSNISAAWAIYYAPSNLVILATGVNSSSLQPVVIHHGQFTRLKPFELDSSSGSTRVLEKDVFTASIYGSIYVMVIRYNAKNSSRAELHMYELFSDGNAPGKLRYVLYLGFSDGFGINVMDNMILVHHQPTGNSRIFDVALAPNRPSHCALIHTTIFSAAVPSSSLYTQYWHIFLPNIVVDPVLGMMYDISLRYDMAIEEIEDKCVLLEFLIHRSGKFAVGNSVQCVVDTLFECLKARNLSLKQTRKIFTLLAENVSALPVIRPSDPTKSQLVPEPVELLKLDQKKILSSVFIPLKEEKSVDRGYLANVMLAFLHSLHAADISVDAYFFHLLVEVLATAGQMHKLQQLVTYRIIEESKQLAFLLVSYDARSPHISQCAMDILARQKASEQILEILLDKGHIIDAARYMDTLPASETYIAKLLEASANQDRQTAHAVQTYLAKKTKSDVSTNASLYPGEEVATAEKEVALCHRVDD